MRRTPARRAPTSRLSAAALAAAVALLGAVGAPVARAELVDNTTQAAGAGAQFLSGLIPPGPPAGICLVDTGVTPNPDTTAVTDRLAVSGSGEDQSPSHHGTQMAMYIGAGANAWGMVGLWPAARIVSVRANVPGQDTFTAGGYSTGIQRCDAVATFYGLKVIELALSSDTPLSVDDAATLATAVGTARAHGLNVVAAAGNVGGQPVGAPANLPGVLSVGAADNAGGVCSFSASGAQLLAPGCGLDGADPTTGQPVAGDGGTSQASAITAAALAALHTYAPALSPDEAEQLLTTTATPTAGGRLLNLTAAFHAAGLDALLTPPSDPAPLPPAPTPPTTTTPEPRLPKDLTPPTKLPKPKLKVRAHTRHGRVTVTITASNRPAKMLLRARVYTRTKTGKLKTATTKQAARTTLTIHLRSWARVSATFLDPGHHRPQSAPATTNAPHHHTR